MSKIKTLVFAGGKIHDFKGNSEAVVEALSEAGNFEITKIEEDLSTFVKPNLDQYDLLVLYYTLGELTDAQKNGLFDFVSSGKGFVGIHSAADSFKNCPEYRAMIGGYFVTHPRYREYQVSVVDSANPITKDLVEFNITDEQYILDYDPRAKVLCSALWKGTAMPVAWTKGWGSGRVFYLALGHDSKACRQEMFKLLLQRGALWTGTTPGQ